MNAHALPDLDRTLRARTRDRQGRRRLAGDAVDVLIGACMDIGPVVTIDLSEVYYADDAGVTALGELRARGAVLQSPRPYLALLL